MKIRVLVLLMIGFSVVYAENILLSYRGGVYYTPVTLNGKMQLECVVDSGASLVHLPYHVFKELKDKGSIKDSDILGKGKSQIANGDIIDIMIINIQKLKIGQTEIKNVRAGVGGDKSSMLLGQSALKKVEPWSLDTQKGILIIASNGVSRKSYVSSSQNIGRTEILDFIHHYILSQNSRSLEEVILLYAPRVDYLDNGVISRELISVKKERVFRQWHKIQIAMIKLIETKESHSQPNQVTIKYSATYDLYNDFSHQGKTGQTINTLVLKKENGSIRIVSEKEKTLVENSY